MSTFKPVIIIGAARSGTNMLRDVLTSLDTPPLFKAPQAFSLFALENTQLVVSAVKSAEGDDSAVIVRLINEADTSVALGPLPEGWQIHIADGMEQAVRPASECDEVPPQGLLALRLMQL